MALTKIPEILDALAALATTAQGGTATVSTDELLTLSYADLPLINIEAPEEQYSYKEYSQAGHKKALTVLVAYRCQGASTRSLCIPFLNAFHNLIEADTTLGGLVDFIGPTASAYNTSNTEEGPVCGCQLTLAVSYTILD